MISAAFILSGGFGTATPASAAGSSSCHLVQTFWLRFLAAFHFFVCSRQTRVFLPLPAVPPTRGENSQAPGSD